jgi:hypothetical protein
MWSFAVEGSGLDTTVLLGGRGCTRACLAAAFVATGLLAVVSPAIAQQALDPGIGGRDCQTVRTCNFSRRGAVRGCLSSYTCRTCKTVRSRCDVAGLKRCERVVCTWGG